MAWARAATRLLPLGELAVVPGPHNANYAAAGHLAELFLAFLPFTGARLTGFLVVKVMPAQAWCLLDCRGGALWSACGRMHRSMGRPTLGLLD